MALGLGIASTWYWCLDQEMAQRVLSAKNLDHAQIGSAAAGFLKILPVLLTGAHEFRLYKEVFTVHLDKTVFSNKLEVQTRSSLCFLTY